MKRHILAYLNNNNNIKCMMKCRKSEALYYPILNNKNKIHSIQFMKHEIYDYNEAKLF